MLTIIIFFLVSCTTYEPIVYEPYYPEEVIEDINEILYSEQKVSESFISPMVAGQFRYWYEYEWEKPSEETYHEETEEEIEEEKPDTYINTSIAVYEEKGDEFVLYAILLVFTLIVGTLSVIIAERNKKNNSSDI